MEYGLVVQWILTLLALGAVSFPLATWLFRGEHGAPFAIPIGLAVLTVVAHLVGQVAFGWQALLAGALVLVAGSASVRRRVDLDWHRFGEVSVVFVLAFLLIVLVRAFDPSAAPLPIAIGEKMLDFGVLATLERSGTLPPEDMWFAGEGIVYHYGGHVSVTLVSMLTGTAPRFAYNLGLATFYATLVTAAYGLAGMVASPYDVPRRLAAGLGAFFVAIAGNLHTPVQFLSWLLPDSLVSWLATRVGVSQEMANWTPAEIDGFWYFDASRVLPVYPASENPYEGLMAATEFPLFAWINGDLHAHMMSQTFMLLAAGILLVYWRLPDDDDHRLLLLLGVLPPLAGLIGFVNVFSFPTVGGLTVVAMWLAPGDPMRPIRERLPALDAVGPRENVAIEEVRQIALGLVAAALVLLLGFVWTFPYWTEVVANSASQTPEFWGRWSPLGGLLLVHGVFLAVFVPYVASWLRPSFDSPGQVAGLWVLGFVAAVLLGAPAWGLFLPMGLIAWWVLRTRETAGYELALLIAGAGLVLLVELVNFQGERFNVIFKFYAPVWLFFAIGASVGLARLAGGLPSIDTSLDGPRWGAFGRVLLVVLVVTSGLYAAVAIPVHVDDGSAVTAERGPTLDATLYVETEYPAEAQAIEWLNEREGQPTIVTAAPGSYYWRPSEGEGSSAPASLTGLPTVLGWFHEERYRGSEPYDERLAAVETIYTGPTDERLALLEEYDVSYIYVGPAERNRYGGITVGSAPEVTLVGRFRDVTIWAYENS